MYNSAQHQGHTIEVGEVPDSVYFDKVADTPVTSPRQVPMNPMDPNIVELPRVPISDIDNVMNDLATHTREVQTPIISNVLQQVVGTAGIADGFATTHGHASMVQSVLKTVKVPPVAYVDNVIVVFVALQRQVPKVQ